MLCADGPVRTLAGLSLGPEHRRAHGALYDAVPRESGPGAPELSDQMEEVHAYGERPPWEYGRYRRLGDLGKDDHSGIGSGYRLAPGAYYALHLIGVRDWPTLLRAALVAGARVAWVAVRARAPNPFAMLMVIAFGVGLALAFVTGDARFLLVKDSITTAAVGITFLVMVALGRPLTLATAKAWEPERAAGWSERFRTNPAVRHWHRTASIVWGAGLLTEAIVRVPLIYLLPIHVMVAVSAALEIVFFGALIGWTRWYMTKIRKQ